MIRLNNLYKIYESKDKRLEALSDVSLTIEKGKIFGIIGRSGAGKSTLIRMLNLLERPNQGQVYINNEEITAFNDSQLRLARQKIGMVFQHFNLLNSRTVLDNVAFPLRLIGMSKHERQQRALELLQIVGLQDHAEKYPSQLSGGQKQRVGIARSLANNPELLLCDEATSALDPETTKSILSLLQEINRQFNLTIVMITHSMDIIRSVCDEVAVIDLGKIVEHGEVLNVFLHPQHATTVSLLSESGIDADGWKDVVGNAQGKIIRLSYRGAVTAEPVLSRVSRELNVNFSILQGVVGKIKETPYGQLVLAVQTTDDTYEPMIKFFKEQQVDYEVLRP